jgi:putative serine protease PepD
MKLSALLAGAVAGAVVAVIVVLLVGTSSTQTTTTVVKPTTTAQPVATTSSSELSVSDIYNTSKNGVVDIIATTESQATNSFGFSEPEKSSDEGAGVVYNTNGDILTDEHVVAGAISVKVNFADGKSAPATVVGTDPSTDVAVIHVSGVPTSELHPLQLADSSSATVGQPVVAIGSPFSLPETVTTGIVSQVGRTITAPDKYGIAGAIQTDAAINPGNSGGPLLNAQGAVLGLNDQIESSSDQNSGVGFAIPSNMVKKIADEIIAGKKPQHAYIGVELAQTLNNQIIITSVTTGSPAAKAGLQAKDIIVGFAGKPVTSQEQLILAISTLSPGQTVPIIVDRDGSKRQFSVTLAGQPQSTLATTTDQ